MHKLNPPLNADRELLYTKGDLDTRLVAFIDYACPHTRRVHEVLRRASKKFERLNLTLAIRLAPSRESGEPAELAARAAIAAGNQGSFPRMHDALFEQDANYSVGGLQQLAGRLGLDVEKFTADFRSSATTDKLERDRASADASTEVPHTPMLFIDDELYEGVWDDTAILEAVERPLGVRIELASNKFFEWAASAGLVLVVATIAALLLVNLGWQDYEHLRETALGIFAGEFFHLEMTLEEFINDGLMALFFLIVGIEIKREFLTGELSDPSSAMLPIIAAAGGMLVPAALYYWVNAGEPTAHGWGVPMATDIAFTLGILALLGSRVPTSLKVFVSALAIADDLGAILVIALFYGHGFHPAAFWWAAGVFALMLGMNAARVYARTPYMILGVILWYFVFESGLHATLAGVLTAVAIPSRPSARIASVAAQASAIFQYELRRDGSEPGPLSVLRLKQIVDRLREPGFHLQYALETWSNFLILPLFAFFNTGIVIVGAHFALSQPAVFGTVLGLVVGKPLGIVLSVFLAVRLGIAKLSPEISWRQLLGAGFLAGIGFTMSIFIASEAFTGGELQSVKLSVLLASAIAALIGVTILYRAGDADSASAGSKR